VTSLQYQPNRFVIGGVKGNEMSNPSRNAMLTKIRAAIHSGTRGEHHESWTSEPYIMQDSGDSATRIALFAHRVTEYKAWVGRCTADGIGAAVAERLMIRGKQRMVIPSDLPGEWLPSGIEFIRDNQLDRTVIAGMDGVLSGAALGIAQTGTIVLDGGKFQGRRMISLLPDYHLCIIRAQDIVGVVPEAFAQLATTRQTPVQPYTFISGPSATSDIELNRGEGVHGPRTLDVFIVE
jgi:L-lactate dehydrogenase complex protein LldG